MAEQGIVKGDALQRIGSLGFIVGGVLLIVFSALLPRVSDPTSMQDVLTAWGNNEVLVQLCGLFIAVGNWGLMMGAAAVYRSIAGAGASWARLGFYGIIVGTTLGTVSSGLLGATASAGADWLGTATANKAASLATASAVYSVDMMVFTLYVLVEWLAIVFLGIGIARSAVYPRWQGWAGLVLGVLTVAAVGIPQFFSGITGMVQVLFAVLATLSALWALLVGIRIARRAW
ncbi:MAG: hypothetical protein HYX87_09720 [Chloroflexi bacterium]|nr:hypothetical protein [Chloroflexota bacterium]